MNQKSFHPIIYVRGYAMTQSEIEDTVADPYMGFNLGSSKLRQAWDGTVKKYFFESPLVRLIKHYGYSDVYDGGMNRVDGEADQSPATNAVAYRSVVIYRYYEPSSQDLGGGVQPDMTRFAGGLDRLILDLRDRVYPEGKKTVITDEEKEAGKPAYENFRVYLVAHSMGGLVVRAFLQNSAAKYPGRAFVDKVFTYATPHNGIDVGLIGNVPGWLSLYGMNTFHRDEMARVLGLNPPDRDGDTVDVVTGFPIDRFFNLVGTDPGDYKVAAGLSSAAVGPASDGLVRIANATTRARKGAIAKPARKGKAAAQARKDEGFTASPNAFVHRSHSGYFGIVNSEEGFQNLIRFLFGDVRADGFFEVDELTLPPVVQKEKDAGKHVSVSYLFEVTISVRGKPWQLHRRLVSENSAILRKFDDLFQGRDAANNWVPNRAATPQLFSVFLDCAQSQTKNAGLPLTLAFAADVCVRSTEYVVDGILFFKDHYEGGYLLRDMVTLEAKPPAKPGEEWKIRYRFENQRQAGWTDAAVHDEPDVLWFEIPLEQPQPPGIRGRLRVETRFWNSWQD
jgi:hypothetical protein